MSLRSQTVYAIVVLLVALGAIFVLVGSGGVSTDVALPESVVSSTPEPSLTPTPVPSADIWTLDETQEAETWTYTDEAGISAQIQVMSYDIEVLATRYQIEPPAEDAQLPVLAVMENLHENLVAQLGITPDSPIIFDEPAVELFGGVPVAVMRLQFPVGSSPDFPEGLDYAFAMIDLGDDQVNFVNYGRQVEPNDAAYGLFEAWLEAHAAELALPEAAATEESEAAVTEEAIGTEEPEPAATEEPQIAATEEAESAATEEPEAAVTEEAAATGTEEAISVAPAERWVEVSPGQLLYSGSETDVAQLFYSVMAFDEFVAQTGLQTPTADSETPLLDVMEQIRSLLASQAVQQGITLEADAIQGPEMRDINGVPAAFLRVIIPPTPGDPQTAFPGQDLVLIIFDLGDGQVNGLQYVLQGVSSEAVYADFLAWVDANMTALTTLPAEEPAPAATEESAPAEAATAEAGE